MPVLVLSAVRDELVQVDPPRLIGGRCRECDLLSFPLERFCAHCGAQDPKRVLLAAEGIVYSYTIVRIPAPGYAGELPYAVGVVELPDAIRISSTLLADPLESLRIGAEVRFELCEVPTENGVALAYAHRMVIT
jgi:uncharacterized protein